MQIICQVYNHVCFEKLFLLLLKTKNKPCSFVFLQLHGDGCSSRAWEPSLCQQQLTELHTLNVGVWDERLFQTFKLSRIPRVIKSTNV